MIKNWIFNKFFKDKFEEAKREGSIDAFQKAHADIRETMADDLEKKANELAEVKLNNLLSNCDLRNIATVDKVKT